MNILAYTATKDGNLISFQRSNAPPITFNNFNEAIEYLIHPCDFGVVWNVDRFAELFMSLIPSATAKELKETGRAYLPLPYRQKLYYQPARVFAITWGYGREVNFYPLNRYADEEPADIKGLQQLADKVIEAYEHFGIEPTKLSSPIAVYGEVLDRLDFTRACDLPDSAMPMLEKCDEKRWEEWREVYKLGHWNAGEVTDFDIAAAYPYLMSKLPDLRGAKFFESDTMLDNYSWGELQGELTITADVTPFLKIGTWEDSITTDMLWAINKYEWGEFKLKHGWFFQLPRYYKLPFNDEMQRLYEKRHNPNPLVQRISKAISVGVGGKLAQKYDDGHLGDNYNSIYSRVLTSRCQVKVADAIWRHGLQKDVISVLVDGFLAENTNSGIPYSIGMGRWRANKSSPFLVASLLYEWGLDKHPDGNNYDTIIEMIKANPNKSVYGNVDLNLLSHGRMFEKLPKTGGDLLNNIYTSTPSVQSGKE